MNLRSFRQLETLGVSYRQLRTGPSSRQEDAQSCCRLVVCDSKLVKSASAEYGVFNHLLSRFGCKTRSLSSCQSLLLNFLEGGPCCLAVFGFPSACRSDFRLRLLFVAKLPSCRSSPVRRKECRDHSFQSL